MELMQTETTVDSAPAPVAPEVIGEQVASAETPESASTTESDTQEQSREHVVPKGVQRRIDRLTREKYQAQAEARLIRERLEALEKHSQQAAKPQELKPEQFSSYEDYLAEVAARRAESVADKRFAEREQAQKQEQEARQQDSLRKAWAERIEKARDNYLDFDDVAGSDVPVSPAMEMAIMHSDKGADLVYYLGKNPEIAERLATLPPYAAAVEIGRLEAQITAPKPKRVSAAPAPINPVGSSATVDKDPGKMTDAEYSEWRRKASAYKRRF